MRRALVLVLVALAAAPARGQAPAPTPSAPAPAGPPAAEPAAVAPADAPAPDAQPSADPAEHEFGPLLSIERISITGNTATKDELIRRALAIQTGDVMRASDKRLREARFKVLALGFFREVTLAMHKGGARGQVILEVQVVERGTVVLNRLWFGRTSLSPYWVGADVGERNLLGSGIAVGGGFIYAATADLEGSRAQWATEARVAVPSLLGSRWGAHSSLTMVRGSEAYRVAGSEGDPELAELRLFPYRRLGVRAGTTYDATALTRLSGGLRVEQITATLPIAPTRTLPDGRAVAIDLHLDPGTSHVIAAGFAYDRDTRPDPILPHSGGHLALSAEVGTVAAGGNYQFATLFGRYEHYWPLFDEKHALAIKLVGGVVVGNAPRFDRIHIADVNRMLTPRALGLVLSTAAPLEILGTRGDRPSYGDLGGTANIEYTARLFRGKDRKRVYGGDLFFGVGLWGLAEDADLRARETALWDALPLDLYVDAGIRLDTDIGVFELTIANALGRLR